MGVIHFGQVNTCFANIHATKLKGDFMQGEQYRVNEVLRLLLHNAEEDGKRLTKTHLDGSISFVGPAQEIVAEVLSALDKFDTASCNGVQKRVAVPKGAQFYIKKCTNNLTPAYLEQRNGEVSVLLTAKEETVVYSKKVEYVRHDGKEKIAICFPSEHGLLWVLREHVM